MYDKSTYAGLYARAEYFLRLDEIPKFLPGYELLLKSIIIRKIEGPLTESMLLKALREEVQVIPSNKDLRKERDDALQWMIEALSVADIIPVEHEEDVENEVYSYIREISSKL